MTSLVTLGSKPAQGGIVGVDMSSLYYVSSNPTVVGAATDFGSSLIVYSAAERVGAWRADFQEPELGSTRHLGLERLPFDF